MDAPGAEAIRSTALLRVDGMHCINCVRKLEKALHAAGAEAEVNLVGGSAELRWAGGDAELTRLIAVIDDAGFHAAPLDRALPAPDGSDAQASAGAGDDAAQASLLRIGIAGMLGMQVMMLASTQYFVTPGTIDAALEQLMRHAQWWLTTPALLYAGWPFLAGAWSALRQRTLTMDVTVAAALLLAYGASAAATLRGAGHVYFDSVTMFTFLLLVARYFESRGRAIATRRLHELAAAQPREALREQHGVLQSVPLGALAAGDVVVVGPGMALPADGLLLDASAECDEALLSGESTPVLHRRDAALCAGAINVGRQPLRLRLTRVGEHSTLSQLTRLVHRAQAQRPRSLRLADRIAGHVLLLVLLLAGIALWAWWPQGADRALAVTLAVLAVTCPCALSLATPAALSAATSRLARSGVLVADADALLSLPSVTHLCVDKTGTLTDGRMEIVRMWTRDGLDATALLSIAAALERGLPHPLATAFLRHDDGRVVAATDVAPGRGPRGRIDGAQWSLDACEGDGELSWLALCREGVQQARYGLAQRVRPDAAPTLDELRAAGLSLELLTGDSASVAGPLAERLGIDRWRARQSPQDKLDRLRALQAAGERVWMVGDGLNDAPVLAAADVSTSLASAAALSQSRADVLLLNDRLAGLASLLDVARRTRRIVRENLAWAAAYNLVAVPLALSGAVTPWAAALGMGLSSLIVVCNALRLTLPARRPVVEVRERIA